MTTTQPAVPVLAPEAESLPVPARPVARRRFSVGRALGWADVIRDSGSFFPGSPTLINFARVLGFLSPAEDQAAGGSGASINFLLYLWNSIVYCALIGFFQTLFCAMGGYAFARLRFRFREGLFSI